VGSGTATVFRARGAPTPAAQAAAALEKTTLGALEKELAGARGTIASLESRLAQAKAGGAETLAAAPAPADGPADLNDMFEQAKPLLQSLTPLLDHARRRGTKAMAERRVAELTEKYTLTAEQQEAVKKWFEEKSEKEAEKGKEVMNRPGAGLQDMMALGRGQRAEDGLDEFMAGTLSPEQLGPYQTDRLQERAGRVEQEATRRVTQLDKVVTLDDAQQDQVFAIMARSSPDYDPAMQLEGLGTDAGPLAEGDSRDQAILAVLRPEQQERYEADRQRRQAEAAQRFEAMGIKPPAGLGLPEALVR